MSSDISLETSFQDVSNDMSHDRIRREWNEIFQPVEITFIRNITIIMLEKLKRNKDETSIFNSDNDVFLDKTQHESRERCNTGTSRLVPRLLSEPNRCWSKSDSNIKEQQADYHTSVRSLDPQLTLSHGGAPKRSRLYLMGGIDTSPLIPRRRLTGIPLTMHEDEYISMMKRRSKEWSLTSISDENEVSPTDKKDERHTCMYLHESMCHACCKKKRYNKFISKLGKLFVVPEYHTDDACLKVTIAQYGNYRLESQTNTADNPTSNVKLRIRILSGRRCLWKKYVKLDGSRREEFKFNYLNSFKCESVEKARETKLEIKVLHKKAFYLPWKATTKTVLSMDNIQVDPEDPEEVCFC